MRVSHKSVKTSGLTTLCDNIVSIYLEQTCSKQLVNPMVFAAEVQQSTPLTGTHIYLLQWLQRLLRSVSMIEEITDFIDDIKNRSSTNPRTKTSDTKALQCQSVQSIVSLIAHWNNDKNMFSEPLLQVQKSQSTTT